MNRLYTLPALAAAFAFLSGAAFAAPQITTSGPSLYPDTPFASNASSVLHPGARAASDDGLRLTSTPSDPQVRCSVLQSQFDRAIVAHAAAKGASAAKELRRQGTALCASGKPADGIRKLEQALREIHVVPYQAKG